MHVYNPSFDSSHADPMSTFRNPKLWWRYHETETRDVTIIVCINYELLPSLPQFLHKLSITVESDTCWRIFDWFKLNGRLDILDVDHLIKCS